MSETEQDSYALYGMVAFGFGEVIGGFIIGIIIDKIGSKKTSIVNVIIIIILINVTAVSVNSE